MLAFTRTHLGLFLEELLQLLHFSWHGSSKPFFPSLLEMNWELGEASIFGPSTPPPRLPWHEAGARRTPERKHTHNTHLEQISQRPMYLSLLKLAMC